MTTCRPPIGQKTETMVTVRIAQHRPQREPQTNSPRSTLLFRTCSYTPTDYKKYKPTLTCSVSDIHCEFRFEFRVFGFVDDGEEIIREWIGFGGAVSEEMLRDCRRRGHGLDHIMESDGWELCDLGLDRVLGPIASEALQAQQFLKFHEATQHLCTCASRPFLLPPLLLYELLWLWRCWFLFCGWLCNWVCFFNGFLNCYAVFVL